MQLYNFAQAWRGKIVVCKNRYFGDSALYLFARLTFLRGCAASCLTGYPPLRKASGDVFEGACVPYFRGLYKLYP